MDEAWNESGLAFAREGRFPDAVRSYERALSLEPDRPRTHCNLGTALARMGRVAEALASFDRALELDPFHSVTRWNRALLLLLSGDYAQGWKENEWRFEGGGVPRRAFDEPSWDGSPLGGKRILLFAEQGMGSTLQFVRFARQVEARGGRVLLECQVPLVDLLGRTTGVAQVVSDARAERFDLQCSLLDLPRLLGTTIQTIPRDVPYLLVDSELVRGAARRLPSARRLRVGICWQGNRGHANDPLRSVPLACFAPLARLDSIGLVSLQRGFGAEQLEAVPWGRAVATPWGSGFDASPGAFADTAAVLLHLDLVITVDTAIAHLAGGLGVRAWVAIPSSPDWRWLLGRSDSPWYPTLTLFRQERAGDWAEVFGRMAAELERERS